MNARLRWLAGILTFGLFGHYEAHEIEKHFHPRDPVHAPGIWSVSHDPILDLDHVEPLFPAIQPPGLEIHVHDDIPVLDVVLIGASPPGDQSHDHGGRLPVVPPPPFPPELSVPAMSQQRRDWTSQQSARFRRAAITSVLYYRTV